MLKVSYFALVGALFFLSFQAQAVPLVDIKISVKKNDNDTYTYVIFLRNLGPVLEKLVTPPDHKITQWSASPPVEHPAGNKVLTDDANIVLFGVDTLSDDIVVDHIQDGGSSYHGTKESGFFDTDGDGIKNTTVAWHLPFYGWDLNDTVQPQESLRVSFTADQKLAEVNFWVGGSDDANIWNDPNIMLEDSFGIYDATQKKYLASFFERKVQVSPWKSKFRCKNIPNGKLHCEEMEN